MEYFVSFIDHYSHFGIIYLMKNKCEILDKFKEYINGGNTMQQKGPKVET